MDVALDSFPYNGGTTTTEAVWQGVPVLTFNGDLEAGRASRSLLEAAGTAARLATLRAGMRARLAGSAVCDTETLCRSLENIYRALAAN